MSSELLAPSAVPNAPDPATQGAQSDISRTGRYVARVLQQHLAENADARFWTSHGSAVFIDISGFTKLSERLARKGPEGAGQISDSIRNTFQSLPELPPPNRRHPPPLPRP